MIKIISKSAFDGSLNHSILTQRHSCTLNFIQAVFTITQRHLQLLNHIQGVFAFTQRCSCTLSCIQGMVTINQRCSCTLHYIQMVFTLIQGIHANSINVQEVLYCIEYSLKGDMQSTQRSYRFALNCSQMLFKCTFQVYHADLPNMSEST